MSEERRNGDGNTTDQFTKMKLEEEEKEKGVESDDGEGSSTEPKNPTIVGENSEYVKLVSNDNHEFFLRRELAEKSKTIREMLRSPNGNEENVVYLRMVNSRILQTLCRYLIFQKEYVKRQGEIDTFPIPPGDAYELLLVAGFFEI